MPPPEMMSGREELFLFGTTVTDPASEEDKAVILDGARYVQQHLAGTTPVHI